MDHDSTNFLKTVSLCCVDECMSVFAFKLISFGQSFFGATFAVHFICQVGFVIGNPSGSRMEILGRKPLWKNGSSSVMSTLMNRPLLGILSSRAPITVTASLGQPGFLNNVILYLVRPRCLATNLTFGNDFAPIAVTAQMRIHTSATAQSLSRTPGIALFER